MSKVHRLKSVQKLPADIETAWRFFSDPHNLQRITPPFLHLQLTNEVFGEEVYAGQVMTYRVRPLLGVPLSWMTEITHVEKMKVFVDEQRKGPYRLWHHQHHFKTIANGVEMTDIVHYRLPLGMAGELVHFMVKRRLRDIFSYRRQKTAELFGQWPEAAPELYID